MKPHHRASLLVGCLGLLLLYLPDALRVAGGWPARPELGVVPEATGASVADLASRPLEVAPLPSPQGPTAMTLDELRPERAGDAYAGGQ